MRSTEDIFESHVKELYKDHEVAAPEGVKDAVFAQLDAQATQAKVRRNVSKSLLVAATVIVAGVFYFTPNEEVEVTQPQPVESVEVSVVETPAVEAPIVEEPVVETPVVEESVVEAPVAEEPAVETPVVEAPVAKTPVVEAPVKVQTEPVAKPVAKPVAEPVAEPVAKPVVVEEKKAKEEEEVQEWVLGGKIKVEK